MNERVQKLKQKCKQHAGKICAALTGGAVFVGNSISALAAETANDTSAQGVNAAKDLMNLVTAQINIANIVAIIGSGIGIAAATWLAWWGVRKLVRMITAAIGKGKLSL